MKRTTLVAGGAGFLGSHVCESLLRMGSRVVCLDDLSTGSTANVAHLVQHRAFRFLEGDVCGSFDLPWSPDVVLHLASAASPPAYMARPVETLMAGSLGTRNLLEIARAHNARFVLASTSEVYGDPEVSPQHEGYRGNVSTTGPRSVYDEAKRFAEALTEAFRRRYGLDTGICRIFNTYGPRLSAGDGRIVSTFLTQALSGEPLTVYGDGSQTRSLCYVEDTVEAIIRLAGSGEHRPVNIGRPEEMSVVQIAMRVLEATESSSPLTFFELPEDEPLRRCPDISRARKVLKWEPSIDLDEGLRRTADWFRARGAVQVGIESVHGQLGSTDGVTTSSRSSHPRG